MSRLVRFLVPLILGLAVLTAAAFWLVSRTTWSWSEKDIALRSQLAVAGARQSLITFWKAGSRSQIRALLADLAHDERIMGAAACDSEGTLLAATIEYPPQIRCRDLIGELRNSYGWRYWRSMLNIPGGDVHVSVIPIVDSDRPLGLVSLVHDMSFVARRESKTRRFVVTAFAVLALGASVLTVVAARLSWRGWNRALRESIRGRGGRPEFRPLLRDLRELVEGVSAERDPESQGEWTPARLKQTLGRHLQGERVIVLANREPYIHEQGSDGTVSVLHPASGLVTALEPVMRACSGVWVGHGSGSADRSTADKNGRLRVPPGAESYVLRQGGRVLDLRPGEQADEVVEVPSSPLA